MRCFAVLFLTLSLATLTTPLPLGAQEPGVDFFEQKIRPVLVEHCYSCHSQEAQQKGKLRGGLRLDTREGIRKGGDSGPAVVPGKPAASLLLQAVGYDGALTPMPPRGKLPPVILADLRRWIEMGAPDPRREVPLAANRSWDEEFQARRQWWSLQPVRRPALPEVRDAGWAAHPVDRFVRAHQEQQGLEPSPEADRPTLLRRLTFALTGLPPTPAELAAFVADDRPGAYERVVDRLLASPHFGERWASHWLDLVRYAESHGSEGDPAIPHAWRYRDYVIRAFNADVPYNRLVLEHLAGDLLADPRPGPDGINESALGLAHLRMVEHGFQPVDSLDEQAKTIENQIEVVTKAFQGLTVACARCHDHKFDAISQRDYYALYGILASSRPGLVTIDTPAVARAHADALAALKREIRSRLAAVWLRETAALPERLLRPPAPAQAADAPEVRVRALEQELASVEAAARATLPRLGTGPRPLAAWRFDGDARDVLGTMHGERLGGAEIREGRLVLNGRSAHVRTQPLPHGVRTKTLEAWVALGTLDQAGGGVLTLESKNGAVFDSLVFAERRPRQWLAGSDHFRRTRDLEGPAETSSPGELAHLAAVYHADGTIAFYRNGLPYGKSYTVADAGPVEYAPRDGRVLLGLRHTGGGRGFLAGAIEEARLYDRALSAGDVAASYRAGPGLVSDAEVAAALPAPQRQRRAALLRELGTLRQQLAARPAARDPWAAALAEAGKDRAHPLHPWVALRDPEGAGLAAGWRSLVESWRRELAERRRFNQEQFTPLWDLSRPDDYACWFRHGTGLPAAPSAAGEFFIPPEGDRILHGIYPAGVYSHLLSSKHNGVLTSPRFRLPANAVSVRFLGSQGGGVRVIVDNYPLGNNSTYPQSRPTRDSMAWVRLDTSYRKGSDAYLEFATRDDLARQERPDGAQDEGRSLLGVAQVVFHDGAAVPRDEVEPIQPLLHYPPPATRSELAGHLGRCLREAVSAWREGTLSDPQAAFLDVFVRAGLLSTRGEQLPDVAPLVAEYRRLERAVPVPRRAPGVLEAAGHDQSLFTRGNHKSPAEVVPRRYLEVLGSQPYRVAQSGRLQLAADLVRPENPLTARVLVNRVWHWLFGQGLVPTVDNFGRLGELPSHPELLDYLASRFQDEGWSVKALVRLLVTSRTFRLSSTATDEALQRDPANRWLTRARVQRLDAEAIRDGLLAIAGELNPAMYGPSVRSGALEGGRRSIYLAVLRNAPQPFLEVFDRPAPATTRGRRDVTNTPAQALALMNSPFVNELARRWGGRLATEAGSPEERVRAMLTRALGRQPAAAEVRQARAYLEQSAREQGLGAEQAAADPRPWQDLAQAVLSLKETLYLR